MTLNLKERYVTDGTGNRIAVIIDLDEYHKVLQALEELESITAYDEAKASGDEAIPFDEALKEIENSYK